MPGATIRIDVPIRHLRQRQVRRSPLRPAGGPVHGRARQRMAERHALADREQPVRRIDRGERDPEPITRALQEQRVADRLGRREQQQALARPRGASRVAGRSCSRSASRDHRPPACRIRRPAAWATGPGGARPGRAGCRASPRGSCRGPARPARSARVELSSARASPFTRPRTSSPGTCCELLAGLARGEHEPDRLGQQPSGDEGERERRRLIQPLRVVDDAEQGTSFGHFARPG